MQQNLKSPFHHILLLILAGEVIFILPFVLARIFRPTFLEVFGLSNLELGICFSVYGIVALASYVLGGPLADKFAPRKLMAAALGLTAIGGFYMASFPGYVMMRLLFGYWGFTTIFLFWAAMIKATRAWGGIRRQGRAFGFLEGGRGFVAASMGALGLGIFSVFMEVDESAVTFDLRQEAFSYVIIFSSTMVALVGLLVLLFMRTDDTSPASETTHLNSWMHWKSVLKIPSVAWLMVIVLCAYVGYKLTDIFSLYANEVMLFDEVEAAQVGTLQMYLRPVVALSIGLAADKTRSINWIITGFVLMLIGASLFSFGRVQSTTHALFMLSLVITASGTYAVRALYFAVMETGKIPLVYTGTAVGLISVIGYTPDIFVGPIMGYLLDNSPGIEGHQQVFRMLLVFATLGLVASLGLNRSLKKERIST